MVKDLFAFNGEKKIEENAPLAERLRPKTLDEFVGQKAILAEGRLLRRAIAADRVGNLLLHGPPGVGKTTLAKIIAGNTRSHFSILNAVLAGVKELRKEVDNAKQRLEKYGLRSILFVDEVHRFNTAQQDALLPWVENGTLTFIGATTENPFFEVNKALVSRSRLFRLHHLESEDLHKLLNKAIMDCERGYGKRKVRLREDAAAHLVNVSNGDARSLLNALELAVESTEPNKDGWIDINLMIAEESIQERAVLYDKQGDAHFDTISAFIKSLRGSDPDAALFWLARMIEAGEDPKFIFRRMLISAGEDIGLADPQAVVVVESCAAAFDRIGLPEGLYALTQATLYLAATEKSNSLLAFFEAIKTVRNSQAQDVPNHLRDSHRDKKFFGDGIGYRYPHAFTENWILQQYLPDALQGEVFWKPGSHGWEGTRREKILSRRASQLAAIEESSQLIPNFVGTNLDVRELEKWSDRQAALEGERLQKFEKKLWSGVTFERNHRVLMIGSSSFLWALCPLRNVPEGGVTIMSSLNDQSRLSSEIELLDFVSRPVLIGSSIDALMKVPASLLFECIGGRMHWKNLNNLQTEELWTLITHKSASNATLRLLISGSFSGPAKLIKETLINQNYDELDLQLLEDLILLETKHLNFDAIKLSFLNNLKNLGWKVKLETWEEKISLKVSSILEERWFGLQSKYREFLLANDSISYVENLRKILLSLKGKDLSQLINHTIISAKLEK